MRLFQTNILLAYDNVNSDGFSLLCGTVNFFGFEFKAGISAFTVLTLILQIYQASQVRFPQTEEGRLHLWRFSLLGDAESGGLAASILAVSLAQGTVPKGNLLGAGHAQSGLTPPTIRHKMNARRRAPFSCWARK